MSRNILCLDFPVSYTHLDVYKRQLQRVNETSIKTGKLLEEYEAGQARHELDELFWKDFCDYYIEIVKERLYQPGKHGADRRRSGQYALYSSCLLYTSRCV